MSIKITGDVLQSGTTTVATLSTTSFALANTAALTASNGLAVTGSSEFNDEVVIRGDLTVLGTQTLGDAEADSLAVTGHATFNGEITASMGALVKDDQKLYFGDAGDASFEYDEDGTDTLLYDGASLRITDDTKLEFGTGGDASFEYDEDGNDVLVYDGTSMRFDSATKLEFGDAGTFVHQSADGVLTIESDTTVDINGAVVMDGALTGLTSINVDGTITGDTSLTIDAVTLTDTELGYLDGLTLGTAAASKVMTWAANSSWTAAGGTCANLGTVSAATSITATDLVGTNIDGIIGADTARAGSFAAVTATSLNCSDGNITNVGDIALDSLTADGSRIIVNSDLTASQGASFGASVGITAGGLAVVGASSFAGNVAVTGTLNVTSNLVCDSDILPDEDNAGDLGSGALRYAQGHIYELHADQLGQALNCNSQTMTNVDVDSGNIDGTVIGANSAVAGTFAAIVGTGATINGNAAVSGTLNVTSTAHFDSTMDVEGALTLSSTADAKARSFITYSDATLKQDIKPLDSALDKVMSMRGVSYEFKNQTNADGGTHREVGFLAQEMKQTVPEVVYGSGDGNLGIDYAKLTSVLVEAVKSQQSQIEELRAALLKK